MPPKPAATPYPAAKPAVPPKAPLAVAPVKGKAKAPKVPVVPLKESMARRLAK